MQHDMENYSRRRWSFWDRFDLLFAESVKERELSKERLEPILCIPSLTGIIRGIN